MEGTPLRRKTPSVLTKNVKYERTRVEGEPGVKERDQVSGSKTGDLSCAQRLKEVHVKADGKDCTWKVKQLCSLFWKGYLVFSF